MGNKSIQSLQKPGKLISSFERAPDMSEAQTNIIKGEQRGSFLPHRVMHTPTIHVLSPLRASNHVSLAAYAARRNGVGSKRTELSLSCPPCNVLAPCGPVFSLHSHVAIAVAWLAARVLGHAFFIIQQADIGLFT